MVKNTLLNDPFSTDTGYTAFEIVMWLQNSLLPLGFGMMPFLNNINSSSYANSFSPYHGWRFGMENGRF